MRFPLADIPKVLEMPQLERASVYINPLDGDVTERWNTKKCRVKPVVLVKRGEADVRGTFNLTADETFGFLVAQLAPIVPTNPEDE